MIVVKGNSKTELKAGAKTRWTVARRVVQTFMFVVFSLPLLAAGWGLLGMRDDVSVAVPTPAEGIFFGSLSSSTAAGVTILDPFAVLEIAFASLSFDLKWLLGALPVLLVYGLIRGRVFCGWVCPVDFVLEGVDWLRDKLGIKVGEGQVPRHAKLVIAAIVLLLSALTSVPVFELLTPVSAINKGLLFGSTVGLWTLLAIVVAELLWSRRVWCRSLCPLGGFYEVLGRVGLLNVRISHDACIGCGKCERACLADPVILKPALDGEDVIVRAGDCMVCGKCVDACPTHALRMAVGRPGRPHQDQASAEAASGNALKE